VKAFFSHSHVDNELVNAVASRVGRPFVVVDSRTFRGGDDLVAAMERAIQHAGLFVLFASRTALDSVWVDFEVNEARFYQAAGRIKKTMVVILDDRLSAADLPRWLTRSLFVSSRSPGPIARAIRSAIDELVGEGQHRFFVGRAREIADLQAALVPPNQGEEPALVVTRGLPGIGRRTLLRRVATETLGFARTLSLRVEAGDTSQTLAVKLNDLVNPVATPQATLELARQIEGLSSDEALDHIADDLRAAGNLNELVVFYDDGGLLADTGAFTAPIEELVRTARRDPDLLLVAVSNRRPNLVGDLADLSAVVDVQPLAMSEVRQLLALLAKSQEVELTPGELGALAAQVRGYPPAAAAAIQMAKTYGPPLATGPQLAASYSPRPLNKYLRDLTVGSSARRILGILARNSPLPIDVIRAFAKSDGDAAAALRELIDLSLVSPVSGTSWYAISEPVAYIVDREYPTSTIADYRTLATKLEEFLSNQDEGGPYLDISRVFYRALSHAGLDRRPLAYALSSDWLRLAEQFYHQRNYERCLEYADLLLETSPSSNALEWRIKANVKLGRYPEAFEDIARLSSLGEPRDAAFYRGFLERTRGDHREAIKHYERARTLGRGGLALERDLAECYYQTNDLDSALKHVEAAQARQSDNPYVVTLKIKIACKQGDEATARELLPILDEVDRPGFAAHRHSRVNLAFGDAGRALEFARKAVAGLSRPPAEMLSNLALCELKNGYVDEADATVAQLSRYYAVQQRGVILGLRARIALARSEFEEALALSDQFESRDTAIHKAIRRDALAGLIANTSMAHAQKVQLQVEVDELSRVLDRTTWTELDIEVE
jgi:tetratricopeptide (TPR) repeat protein